MDVTNGNRYQETRLGLVLYGGISLAIYINGVAQEFFRAVRGRGVYRLIKDLIDSEIVVDVISGSSAGGINGILLAYALCNELEFSDCASLWRNQGDFLDLLRSPRQKMEEVSSLLDGTYYHTCLEQALASMRPCTNDLPEYVSPLEELDLFVTGTDVQGRISHTLDDAGHLIDVKDHRTVFQLKHRAGRKEPFSVKGNRSEAQADSPEIIRQSLARMAQITGSFPVAFPPVFVGGRDDASAIDKNLRLWGAFDRETYFLDGGILDNKPFTHTIREIFYRLAYRKVSRRLFYVEPDPERFVESKVLREPNVFEVVFKSLAGIPGYESIADDLKMLAAHNDQVVKHEKLLEELSQKLESGEPCSVSALYKQIRISSLAERVIQGILKQSDQPQFVDPQVRAKAAALFENVHAFEKSWQDAEEKYDVYFRLRRLFRVLYACPDPDPHYSQAENDLITDILYNIGRQIKLLEIIAAAMERLIGETDFHWQEREPMEVWLAAEAVLRDLLSLTGGSTARLPEGYETAWQEKKPERFLTQNELTQVNKAFGSRIAALQKRLHDPRGLASGEDLAQATTLLRVSDDCEKRMFDYYAQEIERNNYDRLRKLRKQYEDFERLDAQLFPLEAFAGFAERDVIETVRISPRDAQKGFSLLAEDAKVSGDTLHHFGGFFKKSWRSNDILWGRLDGLCLLVETLLKPDKCKPHLEKILNNPQLCSRLRDGLQETLSPAILFPHASAQTQEKLLSWLTGLTSGQEEERQQALDDMDRNLELLIAAAQLEILYEEVPRVISDALEEQIRWGQSPGRAKKKAKGSESSPAAPVAGSLADQKGKDLLDNLLLTVSAEQLAKQAIAEMSALPPAGEKTGNPQDDGLGRFFIEKYLVGRESLQDVSHRYLWEIALKALPVSRNCLVKATGRHAEGLQKTFFFKLFDWPLRLAAWGAKWYLQQPTWIKALVGVAGVLLALLIFRKLLF